MSIIFAIFTYICYINTVCFCFCSVLFIASAGAVPVFVVLACMYSLQSSQIYIYIYDIVHACLHINIHAYISSDVKMLMKEKRE